MAKTGVLLPVTRTDHNSKSVSAPQLLDAVQMDSLLINRFRGTLTPSKIREIRKDPTIAMMREIILAPAVHTEWTIVEKKNAPEGAKDFIEEQLFPKRLALLQTSFFGCMDFGWMPYEKVLEEKNGNLVYTKFKQLLQDYTHVLIYENSGEFAGYFNSPNAYFTVKTLGEVELFEEECLHVIFEKEGSNWYGRSVSEILEGIYSSYSDVNKAANRFDKKIAGAHWIVYFPVGKTPYNGVDTKNEEIALDILNRLEASGSVAVPDEIVEYLADTMDQEMKGKWRIELLSATSDSQSTLLERLKYIDILKVRAFGIPERSVLEGNFGTKAEAEVHTDMGLGTIDVKHRIIVNQYNQQIVNPLLRLNYGEKAVNTICIVVAPLVDSRLTILRDTYRLLLQNPISLLEEMAHLDRKSLRDELGLQSLEEGEAEKILEGLEKKQLDNQKKEFKSEDQLKREQESQNG